MIIVKSKDSLWALSTIAVSYVDRLSNSRFWINIRLGTHKPTSGPHYGWRGGSSILVMGTFFRHCHYQRVSGVTLNFTTQTHLCPVVSHFREFNNRPRSVPSLLSRNIERYAFVLGFRFCCWKCESWVYFGNWWMDESLFVDWILKEFYVS